MGDIDHLVEGGIPSRGLDEDDEREMEEQLEAAPPSKIFVNWTKAARAQILDGKMRPKLMILAASRAGNLLLHHQISAKTMVGSVVLPELSWQGATIEASLSDPSCYLYTSGPQDNCLLVACQYSVPASRAQSWVKSLFALVQPQEVLVLGSSSPAVALNGMFLVETDAAKKIRTNVKGGAPYINNPSVPFLPPGHVVADLPAAILSHCQNRGIAAKLLLRVDRALVTDSIALVELRDAVFNELSLSGQLDLHNLLDVTTIKAAQKRIDAELDASSYSSLFA
mmetsp:Transcript_13332/g.18209  ORF Transcript_13332/g.18209 Transcript_13332/m.18209 type:complete len:282 (-) Transcript_13332:145-990(-)|eukprot:CAMPEP_0196588738 /NCGR_PEP_ID=MMETSP1081-20130531/61557_1 /TAXON_ID=36882 /ORGANISM="Pyramimonas amylifera, Strain CCMP720" /LENGTH=281 /DNA_ID=CAMNT_0041911337 /DNA_START=55 /DNA_END=900 /DNA_ORIENTATION=+